MILKALPGTEFIRMEMGVPGLDPTFVGIEAEMIALRKGVASKYPNIEGITPLKEETARFVKLFLDVDVEPMHCVPTVGSMMGGMAAFMVVNRSDQKRTGTLFLDPGFPGSEAAMPGAGTSLTDPLICMITGGTNWRQRWKRRLKKGHYSSILYSNPNNPSWICLNEEELKIIGEISRKYDLTVIEDLAYFGMDFRKDLSKPGVPPFQPTVAKYTDNYLLLISSSKAFSYAGQRIGMMIIAPDTVRTQIPRPEKVLYFR